PVRPPSREDRRVVPELLARADFPYNKEQVLASYFLTLYEIHLYAEAPVTIESKKWAFIEAVLNLAAEHERTPEEMAEVVVSQLEILSQDQDVHEKVKAIRQKSLDTSNHL